jgi:hypothetical protein
VREVERELAERAANAPPTFRAVAHAYLDWLQRVRGAKPATLYSEEKKAASACAVSRGCSSGKKWPPSTGSPVASAASSRQISSGPPSSTYQDPTGPIPLHMHKYRAGDSASGGAVGGRPASEARWRSV